MYFEVLVINGVGFFNQLQNVIRYDNLRTGRLIFNPIYATKVDFVNSEAKALEFIEEVFSR